MTRLYAVAKTEKSTKQITREAVQRRKKQKVLEPLPITNIHDQDDPAPTLQVDEILEKSQGDHLGKK